MENVYVGAPLCLISIPYFVHYTNVLWKNRHIPYLSGRHPSVITVSIGYAALFFYCMNALQLATAVITVSCVVIQLCIFFFVSLLQFLYLVRSRSCVCPELPCVCVCV